MKTFVSSIVFLALVSGLFSIQAFAQADMDVTIYATPSAVINMLREEIEVAMFVIAIITLLSSVLLFQLGSNRSRQKQLESLSAELHRKNIAMIHSHNQLAQMHNRQKETIHYLENFAVVAAHDMKAPLRIVNQLVGVLHAHHSDHWQSEEVGLWKEVKANVSQLNQLIEELLAFSRLDQDLPLPAPVDLGNVVMKLRHDLEKEYSFKDPIINAPFSWPRVLGHESLMIQLFQNVLGNAIKYSHPNQPAIVHISYQIMEEERLLVSIADNGVGIAPQHLDQIFDLFKKFNINPHIESTGIGLATCKKIVNYYGGKITAKSANMKGSTISFDLPILSEELVLDK